MVQLIDVRIIIDLPKALFCELSDGTDTSSSSLSLLPKDRLRR